MQAAYLYIRVSTDEQAVKGYSQRSQLDRLTRYCIAHNITILEIIFEDHSAKTFDRPAWSNMMYRLRNIKSMRPNLILFTKWDRFSRNVGDAYYMISHLNKLDIIPYAIDQELDLSVPENKIILAVYLSTSEAENDRRSLNVRQGIHKAKQEGRWTAHVPLGYSYVIESGKKSLCIQEPEATFIQEAFKLVAENTQSVQSVYRHLIASGLKCSPSNFRRILRNPTYYGYVVVPAFEQEKAYLVKGQHPALIDEGLFNEAQKAMNSRMPVPKINPGKNKEQLFLRGFFYCPRCHKRLTGSASRGKKGIRYFYYHCTSTCGFRQRTDNTNKLFIEMLYTLHPGEHYKALYRDIVKEARRDLFSQSLITGKNIATEIDRLIERIIKAKQLLIEGEIEGDDYGIIKNDCEQKIHEHGNYINQLDLIRKRGNRILDKAVKQFSDPGSTFTVLPSDQKHEFLKMAIKDRVLMPEVWNADQIVTKSAGLIWGITSDEPEKSILTYMQFQGLNFHKILGKLMASKADKGLNLNKATAIEVLNFMVIFAKITSKLFP